MFVDIDGTVALHTGVRGPYDTSRYHLDRPNHTVIGAVQMEAAHREIYTVIRVYVDRDRVIEMWRSLGLTVLQVAPGTF